MNKQELLQKITQKKEFSQLPKKDVEIAFSHFEKREVSDEEKIKLTRELLHKVYGAFTSQKLLSPKNKSEEWILRKHLSTRERLPYYKEVYERILKEFENKKISIIDLGAGVNGFSYKFFVDAMSLPRPPALRSPSLQPPALRSPAFRPISFIKVNYIGVEAVGQLVELMNNYFENSPRDDSSKDTQGGHENLRAGDTAVPSGEPEKLNAKAIHESLFNLEKIKKIILETKKPRIIFLFKVLDSLEMLERDYSKKLISEIASLADKLVISFATRSMIKRKQFLVNRNWILDFIKKNFKILDDFEIGGERYICFRSP